MRKIAILGSTGSVGVNALEVVRHFPGRFQVTGLGAGRNLDLLREQALEFRPRTVSISEPALAEQLSRDLRAEGIKVACGEAGLVAIASDPETELVVAAMVGAAGFLPVLGAISCGKDVALANKETLVVAGPIIAREVAQQKVRLLPVDSEHSAIWQCLEGQQRKAVRKLILTASGGPFFKREVSTFGSITVDEALVHPNWRMGKKITIDSATLMNKGLEMIEAHYLFDEPASKLDVIIHPQSVVHSMVEFVDGSVIAQMGTADMRIPIQLALTHPERWENSLPSIDLTKIGSLEFYEPDLNKFPCLKLAHQALNLGGTMTAVLNAANEIAVENFLTERIPFPSIPHVVESTMQKHDIKTNPGLEDVLEADQWARKIAQTFVAHMAHSS
ncbi:1-deoxy-D-xylulose-5-phosphate reductoisomerase [bacterium]|nr:1-deoxy-D-xylulose-5-phosphate reductoisomerase [bacterium]